MLVCKTEKLSEINKEKLNSLLLSLPSSLLYASYPYMYMLSGFLKADVELITVYKNGLLAGFLPLVYRRDKEHGTVCNSLPFYGSNGGMVVSGSDDGNSIREILLNRFYEEIQKSKCIAYTLISNPLDSEGDKWLKQHVKHNLIDERIGQITHLPQAGANVDKALMDTFSDPRPRNIRKAQKENIKVYSTNSKEAMDFLYRTHFDNITAINGIAKEKRFFDEIPGYFSEEEYKIYIAEHEDRMIGALLLFYFNNTVEYFTPAVVESYRNLQPTALIIYQAMIDAVSKGYKNWNWGGTWLSQGGVYDFKKKWGTTDYPYFYYTQVLDEKVYRIPKEVLLKNYQYFFVLPFSALQ